MTMCEGQCGCSFVSGRDANTWQPVIVRVYVEDDGCGEHLVVSRTSWLCPECRVRLGLRVGKGEE
jgi:hypothetical protein